MTSISTQSKPPQEVVSCPGGVQSEAVGAGDKSQSLILRLTKLKGPPTTLPGRQSVAGFRSGLP